MLIWQLLFEKDGVIIKLSPIFHLKCHLFIKPERMNEKQHISGTGNCPQYKLLVDDFVQKIHDGVYRPGGKLPSVREIAEEYNVGRKVAHYAISRLEVMNYVYAESKRGIFVNPLLKMGRFYRLCFYINNSNPMSSGRTIFHIDNAAAARGYDVYLHSNFNNGAALEDYLRRNHQFDGIIFSGVLDEALLKTVKPFRIPYMILGNYSISPKHPQERIDLADLVYERMIQYLRRFPGKKIGALLGGDRTNASDRETLMGFKRAVQEISPESSEKLIHQCRRDGFQECCELFKDEPDVILVYGGMWAGYIKYCLLKNPQVRPFVLVSNPRDTDPAHTRFFDEEVRMELFGKEQISRATNRLIDTIEQGV